MQYFGFDRPSFGIKTFGFGANFDPLDLFAGGKQGVWYDPSDKSTLFQDVAGTVPVTKDGDPVALMKDKSGNGNHAMQSVSTARPVYKTDGILHWLKPDGVDDFFYLPSAVGAALYSGTNSQIVFSTAVRNPITQEVTALLANSYGISGNRGFYVDIYGVFFRIAISNAAYTLNTSFIIGSNVLTIHVLTNRTILTSINGQGVGSGVLPVVEYAEYPTNLMARQVGGTSYGGHYDNNFYGLVITKDPADVQAKQKIEQYLASKSGVTL